MKRLLVCGVVIVLVACGSSTRELQDCVGTTGIYDYTDSGGRVQALAVPNDPDCGYKEPVR